jgi:hypothetical protein
MVMGSAGDHHWAIRTALFAAGFMVACLPAQAKCAQTTASALTQISLICTAASADQSKIAPQQARALCNALRGALGGMTLPPNPPTALHLTVTAANKRSAGLAGAWIFEGGQECAISPVNTRIFDQGAEFALHTNLIKVFFQTNPVPSAPGISTHFIRSFPCALSAPSATPPTP